MAVIARSVSDEAISCKNKDCFAALAMTLRLNFMPLPLTGEDKGGGVTGSSGSFPPILTFPRKGGRNLVRREDR